MAAPKPISVRYVDGHGALVSVTIEAPMAATLRWLASAVEAAGCERVACLATRSGRALDMETTVGAHVLSRRDLLAPVELAARCAAPRAAILDGAAPRAELSAGAIIAAVALRVPAVVRGAVGAARFAAAAGLTPRLAAELLRSLPVDACRPASFPGGGNVFETAFPEPLRPPALALDAGAVPARRDPYAGVGWSLRCAGAEAWRFLDGELRGGAAAPLFEGVVPGGAAATYRADVDLFGAASTVAVDASPGDLVLFPGACWRASRSASGFAARGQCAPEACLGDVLGHVRAWRGAGDEPPAHALLDAGDRARRSLADALGAAAADALYGMVLDGPDAATAWRAPYAALAAEAPPCAHCGAADARLRCGRCRRVSYCARGCQARAWRAHKVECR